MYHIVLKYMITFIYSTSCFSGFHFCVPLACLVRFIQPDAQTLVHLVINKIQTTDFGHVINSVYGTCDVLTAR